jgi:hypothetical protein
MSTALLQPVVALAGWTMLMFILLYAKRLPAMAKIPGLDMANRRGGTGKDLDKVLPAETQWTAHNYNHLMEQPTVFYAVVLVLAMMGDPHHFNVMLAWAYVGLRVLHSLVQITVNRVIIRFGLFALSSMVLIALTLHAAIAVFH